MRGLATALAFGVFVTVAANLCGLNLAALFEGGPIVTHELVRLVRRLP